MVFDVRVPSGSRFPSVKLQDRDLSCNFSLFSFQLGWRTMWWDGGGGPTQPMSLSADSFPLMPTYDDSEGEADSAERGIPSSRLTTKRFLSLGAVSRGGRPASPSPTLLKVGNFWQHWRGVRWRPAKWKAWSLTGRVWISTGVSLFCFIFTNKEKSNDRK